MKILGVKFLNLNSLKGVFEIRFDRTPLKESGLFAITGPTGAGKTTILDAITLGLYGSVHRHGTAVEECMTRHTAESYSEVTFEAGGRTYKAKWAQRRARGKINGNLQTARMELVDADTETIISGQRLQEVKDKIIDVCGLDYDQFIRSVMLCQGDFTRFLKAKESERGALLENITDTAVYSEISCFIFQKAKKEKEQLQALQDKMGQVDVLSEEALEELNGQLASSREQVAGLHEARQETERKVAWLENIRKLKEKSRQQAGVLDGLVQEKRLHASRFDQADLHFRAMVYKPSLVEIEAGERRQGEIAGALEEAERRLPDLEQELAAARSRSEQLLQACSKEEDDLQRATPIIEEVIAMDARLKATEEGIRQLDREQVQASGDVAVKQLSKEDAWRNLQACENRIEQLEKWLGERTHESGLDTELPVFFRDLDSLSEVEETLQDDQAKLRAVHTRQQSTLDALTSSREQEKAARELIEEWTEKKMALLRRFQEESNDKSLEEWVQESNDLPVRIHILLEQQKLANSYQQRLSEASQLAGDKERHSVALQKETENLQLLRGDQSNAQRELEQLQKIVELQLQIRNYEADRSRLQQGCPCPLCGSEDHPYVVAGYCNELSSYEEKRDAQKIVCETLAGAMEARQAVIRDLEKVLLATESLLQQANEQLNRLPEEFNEYNKGLAAANDITAISAIAQVIQSERERHTLSTEKLTILKGINADVHLAEQGISDQQQATIRLQGDIKELEERWRALDHESGQLVQKISALQDRHVQLLDVVGAFLSRHGLAYRGADAAHTRSALLQKAQNYRTFSGELQQKVQQKSTLENECKNAEAFLKESQERLAEHLRKMEEARREQRLQLEAREQLFGNREPARERARLEGAVQTAREEHEGARAILQGLQEQAVIRDLEKVLLATESLLQQANEQLNRLPEECNEQLQVPVG